MRLKIPVEVTKFGIYIMFPIATLFLFNEPDILSKLPSSLDLVKKDIENERKTLFKIPQTFAEVKEKTELIKEFYKNKE
ncbi:hypothetical protein HK103_006427 [Boothiomyces macroporosus]|uniref:Uncharacterized protein n=1 Tax=Boothiomyces macroporosus TaxID=261099 RepID=A0AAD5Y5U1_9FUNG|nr:hypothetical protein HK103_006427 [Boothiomyces macroporosus]